MGRASLWANQSEIVSEATWIPLEALSGLSSPSLEDTRSRRQWTWNNNIKFQTQTAVWQGPNSSRNKKDLAKLKDVEGVVLVQEERKNTKWNEENPYQLRLLSRVQTED
jgi:hypothetical protein